ncbi:MAG: hypothetical protein AB1486_15635 [Planctomycetota bacterium]
MPTRPPSWTALPSLATLATLLFVIASPRIWADEPAAEPYTLGTATPVISSTYDTPHIQILAAEPYPQTIPVHKTPPLATRSPGDFRPRIKRYGSFEGIDQTPWRPPDPTIAVGPSHVLETVNVHIAWWTKAGSIQYSVPLDATGHPGFFEDAGAGTGVFDPKCLYDEHSGRFFVVALEVYSTTAYITFAVSDDSDPNGLWYKYRTNAVTWVGGNSYWVDYPGLGVDAQAFYVTGNLFGLNNGGWAGVKYRVIPKADVLLGNPVTYFDLRDISSASVQAAHVHDSATLPYFVSVRDSNEIRLQAITDPTSSPSLHTTDLPVTYLAAPPTVPTLGGNPIDSLDGRIVNAYYRDGLLYAAHGIRSGSRAVARWYEFQANGWPESGAPTVNQEGEIDLGTSISTFLPAIARNSGGEVAVLMARGAANEYPSIWFTMRTPADPPDTMRSALELREGESGYSAYRWGDYFGIAVDPIDDLTFWGVGQYAIGANSWVTYIGSLGFNPSNISYIGAGNPGSAGITPLLTVDQAITGNPQKISISASLGGVPYHFLLGLSQGSYTIAECDVHIAWPWIVSAPLVIGGLPWPGYGESDVIFTVPSDSGLIGLTLYLQSLILDPGAPAGVSATRAAEITYGDI